MEKNTIASSYRLRLALFYAAALHHNDLKREGVASDRVLDRYINNTHSMHVVTNDMLSFFARHCDDMVMHNDFGSPYEYTASFIPAGIKLTYGVDLNNMVSVIPYEPVLQRMDDNDYVISAIGNVMSDALELLIRDSYGFWSYYKDTIIEAFGDEWGINRDNFEEVFADQTGHDYCFDFVDIRFFADSFTIKWHDELSVLNKDCNCGFYSDIVDLTSSDEIVRAACDIE